MEGSPGDNTSGKNYQENLQTYPTGDTSPQALLNGLRTSFYRLSLHMTGADKVETSNEKRRTFKSADCVVYL
ncbi:hypothetical protein HUJ05_006501 [Dendroctonus ponderosae]|nr:hypothetical protein HUJ05_006501 [Dendroctonus ponderosae]